LRAVVEEASSLGLAGLRGAALVALGNCLQKLGRGKEAGVALTDAKAIAEETGDTKLEVQALFELSALERDFTGDIEAAIAKLERALVLAEVLGDRPALAEGELRRAFLLTSAGDLAQAEQACVRTAEIGSELDSRREESRATFMRAFIAYQRGRPEEAERLALEAQEWFERTGESYFRVQNLRALSQYVLARDDTVEAERLLREALELAEPSGGWLVADLNSALVLLLVDLGRIDEAEALSRASLEEVPAGDPAARALASVAAARVAAALGDREATRLHAAEALAILDELAHVFELMAARVELGRALAAVGDLDEAAEQLRLAGERASEIGATTILAKAETALAELESRQT
jgi:tetratricopeptide (TPR) repeat protein